MSNTSYPDDAASFPQVESSEEDLAHKMSDEDTSELSQSYTTPNSHLDALPEPGPDRSPSSRRTLSCEVCRSLRLPGPSSINTTYSELQRAAADGCELCKILQQVSEAICTSAGTIIRSTNAVNVQNMLGKVEECAAYMRVELLREGVRYTSGALFYAASGDSCPWPFMTSDHMPDENASIQDCAQSINRMLDECNNRHTGTCNVVDSRQQLLENLEPPRFIPKRLLHIRSDNKSFQIRLRETARNDASLKETGIRYTALSHCWGSTPVIKTTAARVSSFETEGISWVLLPKTFQEAILLAHELGIDYIWIDSLCILQDSVHDWAEQASQMAEIFSNAYLTIAASASQNGSQGLLNRRRTTRKLDATRNGKTFSVWTRDIISHEFRWYGEDPFMHPTHLPLRKRAWCFQEELLSNRIVHFAKDEAVFICRAATTCECDSRWQSRFQLPPMVGTSSQSSCEIWNSVVNHYTQREISFSKDRLPALSSLTHFFEDDSGRYLAGLWESHLPDSLLWWAQHGRRPGLEFHLGSGPPSWSWASIEGVVNHPWEDKVQTNVAEVLDVCTYPSTVDPRGMVSGGQITLRAPLLPLGKISKTDDSRWQRLLDHYGGTLSSDSYFACAPGWASNLEGLEQDYCYCVLDDPTESLMRIPNHIIDGPISLLMIRTLYGWNTHDFVHYPGWLGYLGILLKPLEDLDQTQTKTMEDLGSKLSFVRIGFGGICLNEEDGEEVLHRFGNTTVTIF